MEAPLMPDAPFINSVLNPSDFSPASDNAFFHALAIALLRRTEFTILHTGNNPEDWKRFPAVRATLERWRRLPPGSPQAAVLEQLGVRVTKVNTRSDNPLHAILHYLGDHTVDLIVLATEGRTGLPRWLQPSLAERIAERSATSTLFVPEGCRGFVGRDDGRFCLRRILLPIDRRPSPLPALEYAARIVALLAEPVEIILLHVGSGTAPPLPPLPEIPGASWQREQRRGAIVDEVIAAARRQETDLIVMTTAGRAGILGTLRGSTTRQVLRHSPCPLLAIPGNGF